MNARVKPCIDLAEAYAITRLSFPPLTTPVAERDPEIDAARAMSDREDRCREDSELETDI